MTHESHEAQVHFRMAVQGAAQLSKVDFADGRAFQSLSKGFVLSLVNGVKAHDFAGYGESGDLFVSGLAQGIDFQAAALYGIKTQQGIAGFIENVSFIKTPSFIYNVAESRKIRGRGVSAGQADFTAGTLVAGMIVIGMILRIRETFN